MDTGPTGTPARPTHQVVADELDLTVATVSRLRSGDRSPSLETIKAVKQLTGWGIDEQVDAKSSNAYHTELEKQLTAWWERRQQHEPHIFRIPGQERRKG